MTCVPNSSTLETEMEESKVQWQHEKLSEPLFQNKNLLKLGSNDENVICYLTYLHSLTS